MYYFLFFFFNDTATTEIYTLSLHDALPIFIFSFISLARVDMVFEKILLRLTSKSVLPMFSSRSRSEEHTSELQSRQYLVCRLLLEKKKKQECLYNTKH